MGKIYHGSYIQGLKKIEPRQSTHGKYVYGTNDKALALHFCKRCGDDMTYSLGHFDDKDSPWELVENIPAAFDTMYSNKASIYTLSDETFHSINTHFNEVVSEKEVDVIEEEKYNSVIDGLIKLEKEGLIKIYRYPNKPKKLKETDILDKYRYYNKTLNKTISKNDFERLVYLYPNLLFEINQLSKELGYNYYFEDQDIIKIFKERFNMQQKNRDVEQYIESSYISICNYYKEFKEELDNILNNKEKKK